MSDLQLGLLIIGALVVLAVVVYNKWQEHRLRRKTESAFSSMVREDVLLGGGSTQDEGAADPTFALAEAAAVRVEHIVGDLEAPADADPEPVAAPAPDAGAEAALPYAELNEALDCIVTFDCPTPVNGAWLAARAEPLFDLDVARLMHWEGYDEVAQSWGAVRPEQDYSVVRAGLQLATHAGPIPQYQLESFASATVELALQLSADVNVIDTESVYQQAVKLEHFLNEFDVQVGLSVVTDGGRGIPGTKIRGVAESAGFELGKDGRYHRYDESGVELYTLANMEPMPFHLDTLRTLTTRGVTLLLNVPRAPGVPATFRSYIQFARQLAEALDGTIVDDNRQPIGERAIEQVGAQLSAIHEAMAAAGIPAGSPAARRLFAA